MVLVATQVKRRRGTTAENDAFTGAEGEITVDTEKHQLRVHDGETQGGFVIGSGGSGRNIGDIFYTKRTDTGLAGAVECNGGTYNTEDYTGAGSIGELLAGGKLDYISLTDYATAISTKGYCDKIGWDGTGTTSFRVPKLAPRRYVVKEQKPTAGNNYTWYRLYNDGWTEQGGQRVGNKTVSFPVAMADTNYFTLINSMFNNSGTATWFDLGYIETKLETGMTKGGNAANYNWFVAGMSAITSDPTERAMFQLFNGTTDEAVATVGTVVAQVGENTTQIANRVVKGHELIDFQIPTAANGYTWYRKYADGWVEQGGDVSGTNGTITFPITMAGSDYQIMANVKNTSITGSNAVFSLLTNNLTTTSFGFKKTYNNGSQTGVAGENFFWQVSGMAAA